MRHVPPHEVADAKPVTRKELPVVLVLIDKDSRVQVLQSDDVLVAYVDEREAHDGVVLLPRENRIHEIMAALAKRPVVTTGEDHKDIAIKTVRRILDRQVVVAGMKE